jgi:DNA-binding CsgD family transcriptional regulator
MKKPKSEYINESEIEHGDSIEKAHQKVSLDELHRYFDEGNHNSLNTRAIIKRLTNLLTPRQVEVMTLLGQGFEVSFIALNLAISERKVRYHRQRIKEMFDKIYPTKRSLPRSRKGEKTVLLEGTKGTRIKPTTETSVVPSLLPFKKQ